LRETGVFKENLSISGKYFTSVVSPCNICSEYLQEFFFLLLTPFWLPIKKKNVKNHVTGADKLFGGRGIAR
jgi:cytidine deaminase